MNAADKHFCVSCNVSDCDICHTIDYCYTCATDFSLNTGTCVSCLVSNCIHCTNIYDCDTCNRGYPAQDVSLHYSCITKLASINVLQEPIKIKKTVLVKPVLLDVVNVMVRGYLTVLHVRMSLPQQQRYIIKFKTEINVPRTVETFSMAMMIIILVNPAI